METDYISRQVARPDAFCDGVSCQECPFLKNSVTGGCRVDDFIKAIPAADVRPVKRGEWIPVTNGRGGHECDQCHNYAPSYQTREERLSDFCPCCGADMTGGEQDGRVRC